MERRIDQHASLLDTSAERGDVDDDFETRLGNDEEKPDRNKKHGRGRCRVARVRRR